MLYLPGPASSALLGVIALGKATFGPKVGIDVAAEIGSLRVATLHRLLTVDSFCDSPGWLLNEMYIYGDSYRDK